VTHFVTVLRRIHEEELHQYYYGDQIKEDEVG